MKKFLIQAVGLIVLIFTALAFSTGKIPNFQPLSITKNQSLGQLRINDKVSLNIEIANTQEKRRKGLSGRESLASDSGMLFKFDKIDKYSLWMKGMKIPLDFIWIKDFKVVDLIKNVKVPEPGTKDKDLSIYMPATLVDSVLEVNSGFVDLHDIKIGDTIEIVK